MLYMGPRLGAPTLYLDQVFSIYSELWPNISNIFIKPQFPGR